MHHVSMMKVLKDISYSIPYVRTVCNYVFLYIMQRYAYRFTILATMQKRGPPHG